MSALTHSTKSKFGGFFKSLFGKSNPVEVPVAGRPTKPITAPTSRPVTPVAPYKTSGAVPGARPQGHAHNGNGQGNGDFNPAHYGNGNNNGHSNGNGDRIQVSLQAIICNMSAELRGRVRQPVPDGMTVAVPLDKVISQLSQGAVKLTFGEIRKASGQIFAAATDADQQLVSLPLSEILPHVNPAMLPRRQAQKRVQISDDISSPFASGGRGLTIIAEKPRHTPSQPAPVAPPRFTPAPPAAAPRPTASPTPTPSVPMPPPTFPAARPAPAPVPSPEPIRFPSSGPAPVTPPSPALPSSQVPSPKPLRFTPPAPTPAIPQTAALPSSPVPQPAKAMPTPSMAPLLVTLSSLAENWPDAVRQEIVRLNLSDAQVALPANLVENGLKRGRVTFPWKILRSLIRPAPLPSISVNDSTELELPLNVLAPLFFARRKAASGAQQKVSVDESIPNLFFGFPQPESPATVTAPAPASAPVPATQGAATKPADTNYYTWEDGADNSSADEAVFKRKGSGGTEFINRCATPNEIVSRAASLDGVAGALIALPDGLMVANRIPTDLNGDTLAAFLPQLFNKMSQCTRELRMGELNNLNFTVGNVPWKIFRVNAVFFAAFGRAGEGLPTAQLASLAGELDRKNK